jgi:hypothetical protein
MNQNARQALMEAIILCQCAKERCLRIQKKRRKAL